MYAWKAFDWQLIEVKSENYFTTSDWRGTPQTDFPWAGVTDTSPAPFELFNDMMKKIKKKKRTHPIDSLTMDIKMITKWDHEEKLH